MRTATARAQAIAPADNEVPPESWDPSHKYFHIVDGWKTQPGQAPEAKGWRAPPGGDGHRLCVIVPFRDENTNQTQAAGRWNNLREFVPYMVDFLTKARGPDGFRIHVIEQQPGSGVFNKGAVMNIGYLLSYDMCDYFVFHDVDQLPINSANTYAYPVKGPVHLCAHTSQPGFKLYPTMVGGALALTREQYWAVGGYGSNFWGWGIEDDDMYKRIQNVLGRRDQKLARLEEGVGSYRELGHPRLGALDKSKEFDASREWSSKASYGRGHAAMLNGLYTMIDWKVAGLKPWSAALGGGGDAAARVVTMFTIVFRPDQAVKALTLKAAA